MEREKQLLEISKLQEQMHGISIPPEDAKHNPFRPAKLIDSVPSSVPPQSQLGNSLLLVAMHWSSPP